MRIAVVTHVDHEGPGLLGAFLRAGGVELVPVPLHRGAALPPAGALDAALVMGGPMNVYEEDAHPFLRGEDAFLREAAERRLPVLGICLGAQLVAKAGGAPVTRNAVEEVGWGAVALTGEAAADPLLGGLPAELPVFQWHGDTFAVPGGGTLLATGERCRNQAFRLGASWGLQFHLEADRGLLEAWFGRDPRGPGMLARWDADPAALERNARRLAANFLEIAASRATVVP